MRTQSFWSGDIKGKIFLYLFNQPLKKGIIWFLTETPNQKALIGKGIHVKGEAEAI